MLDTKHISSEYLLISYMKNCNVDISNKVELLYTYSARTNL